MANFSLASWLRENTKKSRPVLQMPENTKRAPICAIHLTAEDNQRDGINKATKELSPLLLKIDTRPPGVRIIPLSQNNFRRQKAGSLFSYRKRGLCLSRKSCNTSAGTSPEWSSPTVHTEEKAPLFPFCQKIASPEDSFI